MVNFVRLWACAVIVICYAHSGTLDASPSSNLDQCVDSATTRYWRADYGFTYEGGKDLVEAIVLVENGCGRAIRNRDRSIDFGCMQINSSHLSELARYGIGPRELQFDNCQNIMVGTWILFRELLKSRGDLWRAIGNYNTGSYNSINARINRRYQLLVWSKLNYLWKNR